VIEEAMQGYMLETIHCSTVQDARTEMVKHDIALVLCEDSRQQGKYQDLLAVIPRGGRRVPIVVVMSEENLDQTYREAMEKGAFDVIASPCSKQDVQWVVIRAMDLGQLPRTSLRS
jgi:DNA-binding NtrC family response regulator